MQSLIASTSTSYQLGSLEADSTTAREALAFSARRRHRAFYILKLVLSQLTLIERKGGKHPPEVKNKSSCFVPAIVLHEKGAMIVNMKHI